ncbi:peptide chain release factor 2 [Patescibacteria group bacterium]
MSDVIKELQKRAEKLLPALNIPQKQQKMLELEELTSAANFWSDREKAQQILKRIDSLREEIKYWGTIEDEIELQSDLLKDAIKTEDAAAKKAIEQFVKEIEKEFQKRELEVLFTGEYDESGAIVAIHAGTGGVDAQDWAEMLLRMYLRFFENMKYDVTVISESRGEEAGIKSAVIEVEGRFAFGYLQSENGVHRLVRQSPFNSDNLRQTSFALVEVIPLIDDAKKVAIDEKELRIDTYRASGAGGQHVNKTDSAVRVIHLPTGITTEVQSERSQLQNKTRALKILQSKLQKYIEAEKEEEKQKIRGEYSQAEWGNQIRSYVLHPYKMVKDHRTKKELPNAEAVLDGEVFPFVEAFLRDKAKEKNETV